MQHQPTDLTSSPISKRQEKEFMLLSTPETNKGKTTTNPIKYSKMKKSKRRDCTPVYSPPQLTEAPNKEEHFRFYTDKKGNFTFGKLNFDTELKLFQPSTHYKEDKSNFLELIEDSLNEFNGTVLNAMGSQTTPDTIFTTLFNESKENPEKNFLENGKGSIMPGIRNSYAKIEEVCNRLSKGDVSALQLMKPKIIVIDALCNFKEIPLERLVDNSFAMIINEKEASQLKDGKVYVTGKMQFSLGLIEEKGVKSVKEGKPLCRNVKLIFTLDKEMEVKLSCIEVHCF